MGLYLSAYPLNSQYPNLLNELGDTSTVGVIFTPSYDFIPGTLSLAFDVVTIDVVDVVQAFSVSQNMAGCYDYADKPAKFCDTFTRVLDPADLNNGKYNLGDVNSFSFGPNNVGVRNFETHIITADSLSSTQKSLQSQLAECFPCTRKC